MPFFYSVYGLKLCSNGPFLSLAESPRSRSVDIQVWLGERAPWLADPRKITEKKFYVSPGSDERGNPTVTMWTSPDGSYFRILYGDGTEFFVDRLGTQVWTTWPDTLTIEDAAVYLLGPVMGFVLHLRGLTSLHASAVAIGDRAIALMGLAGAGKSTTAAAFARLGYPVLSDDIVPIQDQHGAFFAQSGYACICLWSDSVSSLYGSEDALPLLTPTWDKRYLALGQDGNLFQGQAMPLAAIYILGERSTDSTCPAVDPISCRASLMSLVSNTYMNYLLDPGMRAREFDLLGRLVKTVPVRMLRPHQDSAYLTNLCQVIVDDFTKLTSSVDITHPAIQTIHNPLA
jgi:hypothetical protein